MILWRFEDSALDHGRRKQHDHNKMITTLQNNININIEGCGKFIMVMVNHEGHGKFTTIGLNS